MYNIHISWWVKVVTPMVHCSTRYDDLLKEDSKKQDSMAEKLAKMQQDYQQTLIRAGIR